jgi:tRNA(Ile)-lysidine synthase
VPALADQLQRDDGRPLLVGYSGGLDSSVLLHALATSEPGRAHGLRALHVHHGLHPQADAWAAHCERTCATLGIRLDVVRVAITRTTGHGPEAAARQARHAAFLAALGDDEVLALAHHRDDQAETFLLRALRGSGVDGLGAMRAWRAFGPGWMWRPLLDVSRAELLAYGQQHGLRWIDDPGNADPSFDRNFLRRRVLPLLRERWPQLDATFAASAHLAAEASDLLSVEDAQALAGGRSADPHTLRVDALRALPAARRARVLRLWIAELDLPPLPAAGVARIEADLLDAAADAEATFAWAQARIVRWRDLLHADVRRSPLPMHWEVEWDGRAVLTLPTGDTLQLLGTDGFDAPVRVHTRRGGERITLPGRLHTHALKHVLQDLGVPPWLRARLPLLSDADGRLLAAGDIAHAAGFDAWLRARGAQLVCIAAGD